MRDYTLVTERMYMRLSHPKFAREVADYNERNREFLRDLEPARPKMYYTKRGCKTLLKMDRKDSNRGEEFRFYLFRKGEDKVIGTMCIGSVLFGSVKSGTISYKIDKDYQNQGYCSEAMREMIRFCFDILQLHRIEALVMPRNAKSLAIMKKFSYEQEGLSKKVLEINNKWEDHYRFALINDKVSAVEHYDY